MKRKPTVFLDRDGVLTVEKGYLHSLDELEIFPYARDCIVNIHQKGYYAIVITNQGGVAKGLLEEDELQKMNQLLQREIGVDMVYYCPHHPQGIISKYAVKCNCRKPQIGLIEEACKNFPIDLTNSYMVGDRSCDILAGRNKGIKTVCLNSGYGLERLEENIVADYNFQNLKEFVKIL